MTTFGTYFNQLRLSLRKSLRAFCVDNGFDPGNVSKLERGLMAPPKDEKLLERYARALGLRAGSPEWGKFFAIAATETGKIPPGVLNNKQVMSQLPVLFMALGKKKPSSNLLKQIVKLVRES